MGTHDPATNVAGMNEAVVCGQLVAEPEYRDLPSGSVAVSFSLTVREAGKKTTSVPMCWIDPPDRVRNWMIGEMVVARGEVVRRFYRAGASLGSATEVVIGHAQLARHRAKARKVLAAASSKVAGLTEVLE